MRGIHRSLARRGGGGGGVGAYKRPVTRNFDVPFYINLNKLQNIPASCRLFETRCVAHPQMSKVYSVLDIDLKEITKYFSHAKDLVSVKQPGRIWIITGINQNEIMYWKKHKAQQNRGLTINVMGHNTDVMMSAMASQITSLTIVYLTVYSGTDQRKHQSSVSLAFLRWIHRRPKNSPHKGPVTRKMFPFDDVIMRYFMHVSISINYR